MPICDVVKLDYYEKKFIESTKSGENKEFLNMPIIPDAKINHLSDKVQDLQFTEMKNPRQITSDGTTPLNGASGDGKSSEEPPNENLPKKNWSEELKEGIKPDASEHQDEDGGSSDEESDDDSSDEEEIKAPIELMGEFLQYVRTSDWENASKLCKMILIYEPENPEALQFQSVIAEKAQIEKELAEMSSSSDEEEESSSEEEETEDEEQEEAVDSDSKNHD
uniref:LOW QUALITY PROTEIN: glutamate-rich protein 2-like n=1 Tax=Styela clava TaxID=7725 RepID=UPI001939C904|nr:LOW QUALITY PROTEIN: glutamate-rich protein 2-like [Styela clava]